MHIASTTGSSNLLLNIRLCEAAQDGNAGEVKKLLLAGANPDNLDGAEGHPPLTLAAEKGHVAVLKLLLDHGANINIMNKWGKTALYITTDYNQVQCLKELLDRGADCNKIGSAYATPLYHAAEKGHLQCLRLLISKKADVNAKFEDKSPVFVAVQEKYHECVKELLVEAKADAESAEIQLSPLLLAISQEDEKAVELLIRHGNVNVNGCGKITPLENGLKVTEKLTTPLMCAVRTGNTALVKLLLEAGADPNIAEGGVHLSALHHAAQLPNRDILKLLIEKKAFLNGEEKKYGYRPIDVAKEFHQEESVEILRQAGADEQPGKLKFALFDAVKQGKLDDLKRLLKENKVDINTKDLRGNGAVVLAIQSKQPACLAILIEAGADLNRADSDNAPLPFSAVIHDSPECLQTLIDAKKVDLKARYSDMSLVDWAIRLDRKECLKLLKAK